jgi:hypothetical protein
MNKIRYDSQLLNDIIVRDKAKLLGEYPKLNQTIKITFNCSCGEEYTKVFRQIHEVSGAFCKECTYKNGITKKKKTNLERFGTEVPCSLPEIQEKMKETSLKNYGTPYASQSKIFREKVEATNIKNFGVPYPAQNPEVIEKMKETCLKNNGVEYSMQSNIVKEKAKKTFLKKYGKESPFQNKEIREKMKESMIKKYGVENPSQNPEIQAKKIETNISRFGVPHAAQNKDIQIKSEENRNDYYFKNYIMPSGEIRKLQGYENFALDILIKIFNENQIITSRENIPIIKYMYKGNEKVHFPDIFIPHLNKIIEVKSNYTYKIDTDKILAKSNFAIKEGFDYEIWIFNNKGIKLNREDL